MFKEAIRHEEDCGGNNDDSLAKLQPAGWCGNMGTTCSTMSASQVEIHMESKEAKPLTG